MSVSGFITNSTRLKTASSWMLVSGEPLHRWPWCATTCACCSEYKPDVVNSCEQSHFPALLQVGFLSSCAAYAPSRLWGNNDCSHYTSAVVVKLRAGIAYFTNLVFSETANQLIVRLLLCFDHDPKWLQIAECRRHFVFVMLRTFQITLVVNERYANGASILTLWASYTDSNCVGD